MTAGTFASQRGYFFVVGSPRSGTTLLQSMLMRAPGVTIPPETHFMNITWQRRGKMPDLRTDAGWERAVTAVRARTVQDEIELSDASFDRRVESCPRTYADLLRAWLDAIGDHEGARVVGEKSPGHTAFVTELAAAMPGAKFIHIVRDPRDVVLSQKEVFGRPAILSALRWRLDLRHHHDAERLLPRDRYRLVKYEDLVADPESAIRPLAEFLGLTYSDEMINPGERDKAGFSSMETHKLQTLEKVTTGRIGRYKGKLSKGDIAATERLCAELMRGLGYELENSSTAYGTTMLALRAPGAVLERFRRTRSRDRKLDHAAETGQAVYGPKAADA
ncbi:MAG: sulfotransferase [Planctomycetota bacterium]